MIAKGSDPTGWRLPAPELERVVATSIGDHIAACAGQHALVATETIADATATTKAVEQLVSDLKSPRHLHLRALVDRSEIANGSLRLVINHDTLANLLGVDAARLVQVALSIKVSFAIRRRGVEAKMIAGPRAPAPDVTLVRALANAHRWVEALRSGSPLKQIAATAGKTEAQVRTRARLAFLAPAIQQAILDGTQPADMTLEKLLRTPLALDCHDQETAFGRR